MKRATIGWLVVLVLAGCRQGDVTRPPDVRVEMRAREQQEALAEMVLSTAEELDAVLRDLAAEQPFSAAVHATQAQRAHRVTFQIVGPPVVLPPPAAAPTEEKMKFLGTVEARVAKTTAESRRQGESVFAADAYNVMRKQVEAESAGKEVGRETGKLEAIQNLGLFARVGNKIDGMLRTLAWILGGTVLVLLVVGFFFPAVLPVILSVIGRIIGAVFTLGASALGELKAWRQRRIERAALENTVRGIEDFRAERPEATKRLGELLEKHQGPETSPARTVIRQVKAKVKGK